MDFSNIFHQMEIEKLIRQSIQIIKDKYGLPEKGLLAGGSIANIVYGLHTNKDIVVNDIDIFILDRLVDYDTEFRTNKRNFIYTFGSKRKELIEDVDYNGIVYYRNILYCFLPGSVEVTTQNLKFPHLILVFS